MIRRRHDRDKDKNRIPHPEDSVENFRSGPFPRLPRLEGPREDASVVEHGAADDEGVAEMHARHCGEGVDVVAAHPDGAGVVVADGVEEAVLGGEEAGGHAGVEGEGEEGEEVGEREGAADCGEGGVGGGDGVVPCYEAVGVCY